MTRIFYLSVAIGFIECNIVKYSNNLDFLKPS